MSIMKPLPLLPYKETGSGPPDDATTADAEAGGSRDFSLRVWISIAFLAMLIEV